MKYFNLLSLKNLNKNKKTSRLLLFSLFASHFQTSEALDQSLFTFPQNRHPSNDFRRLGGRRVPPLSLSRLRRPATISPR